jgi:hypothetical protein
MNTRTLGVCCIGNPGWKVQAAKAAPKEITVRPYLTQRQLDALVHWLAVNCKQYDINPLGTMKRPSDKKTIPTITQHSDHDSGKPFCASLRLEEIRKMVAKKL